MKSHRMGRIGFWALAVIPSSALLMVGAGGCSEVLDLEPWTDPAEVAGSATGSGAGGAGASSGGPSGGPVGVGGTGDSGATCADGVQNGDQTDVDCGGDSCDPCNLGQKCVTHADCQSGQCSGGKCVDSVSHKCEPSPDNGEIGTCNDCKKNGAETGVDCGGDACLPCASGSSCMFHGDCISGACAEGVCAAGSAGSACRGGSDCASALCQDGDCWTGLCCQ